MTDRSAYATILIRRLTPASLKRALALSLLACLAASPLSAQAQAPTAHPAEPLDLVTISRIRDEGLHHSHVMAYAGELTDEIGQRLTGSPGFDRGAQWVVHQLQSIGIADAHEESWGDFGMAWTQLRTTLLLDAPAPATLIAQATPWSPSTRGEISAPVVLLPTITGESQLAAYKGKLSGKVILYGLPPAINLAPKAPLVPIDDAYFKARLEYPLNEQAPAKDFDQQAAAAHSLRQKVAQFFVDEGALAVLLTTSGDANTFRDDDSLVWHAFQKEHRQPIPSAVVAPDSYGRLARLAARDVPATIRLDIETSFGADHVDGQNVLGEIKGSDPALRDQIVMLGAHLDSWAGATGATDDGAGVVIELEALRILEAAGAKPRRTIRVGFWGGEEEGEIGSMRYLNRHFAEAKRPEGGSWTELPDWDKPALSISPRPDFNKLDAYFNLDAGGGRILGIYTANNLAAADVFRQWLDPVRDLGCDKVSTLSRHGIDAERFEELGLPSFQLMQDIRDYDTRTHHTNLDSYERLSEPDLKQAAIVTAIFIFNAAQRDVIIPRK